MSERNPVVYVVLPGDVDDPAAPSGGNRYDRRVCQGLTGAGRVVRELVVAGSWPTPGTATRAELVRTLAALPDGATALLDGLLACAVPDVVVPAARRLRLVVLVHLPLGDETGREPAPAAGLTVRERATLHAVAAVVATSTGTARRLVDLHDLPAERVHVAAPGVDPAPLVPGTEAGTGLLCVAAVTPRKGHDVLLDALDTLDDLPWDCTCVGPLDRDPGYAARVQARGSRTRFVGPRGGAQLAAAYAGADLLVLPSRAEPYGMVVTEALAHGVPVLASAVDGVPEALGRAPGGRLPGLLVPPGDPAALAAALRRWLTEPDMRRDLRSAAAARRATLTGWDVTTTALTAVLDRVRRTTA